MYIIRSVALKNIKSHKDTYVEFAKGVNLIIGDVGAGKTTILEAIEAGLLGFKVRDLLRVGEREGEIAVALEPRLEVRRRIPKKGSGEVLVKLEDGRGYTFTTTQARELVVKKLRLMEQANPNAEPLVTRAAIYVRQEEMKRILDEPESAAEVVKRATGILKFSIARENSSYLGGLLDERAESLKGRVEEISKELERREEYEKRVREAEEELQKVSRELSKVMEELEKLKAEKRRLDKEMGDLKELRGKAETLKGRMEELGKEIKGKEKELVRLRDELQDLKKKGYLIMSEDEVEALKAKVEELRAKQTELVKKRGRFEVLSKDADRLRKRVKGVPFERLKELEKLEVKRESLQQRLTEIEKELAVLKGERGNYEKLLETGKCWVCGREVDVENYAQHVEEIKREASELEGEKASIEERLRNVDEELRQIEEIKALIAQKQDLERIEKELEALKAEVEKIGPVDAELAEAEEKLVLAERGIRIADREREEMRLVEELGRFNKKRESLQQELEGLKAGLERLQTVEKEIEEVGEQIEELDKRERSLLEIKAGLESNISHFSDELRRLNEKERELESLKKEIEKVRKLAKFFGEVMPRYLEDIESAETTIVRAELESKFREYFKLLTQNDDWDVSITDDFSPKFMVRISGRWEEISSPSGGQRSCIAMAYRLALSWVARAHQGLNVGFLMLDEPTDGFSSEQLARFKSLLERLEAEQVIMVSHHEELQSTADQIIRIENIGGVSKALPA